MLIHKEVMEKHRQDLINNTAIQSFKKTSLADVFFLSRVIPNTAMLQSKKRSPRISQINTDYLTATTQRMRKERKVFLIILKIYI